MKIRKGFVSNSSSSSFVVAFPKNPTSAQDVQKILFGDRQEYPDPYNSSYYPTSRVAETVWDDIKRKGRPATKKDIVKAIDGGYFDGMAEYKDFPKPGSDGPLDYDWEACSKENERRAIKMAEEFMAKNPKAVIYTLSYADEDGSYGSALEHGILFDEVPHLRISCH